MVNSDLGGDCKIVVEQHMLGESPKGNGWQFDTIVYFIGKIAVLCQDGSKVGELMNVIEVRAGNREGWGYGGLCCWDLGQDLGFVYVDDEPSTLVTVGQRI